jgi:hypothetical protein
VCGRGRTNRGTANNVPSPEAAIMLPNRKTRAARNGACASLRILVSLLWLPSPTHVNRC